MPIHAREGDFIQTLEGLIFDVKGLVHPQKNVIAFLRYIPDPTGKRSLNGVRYRKIYSLKKRFDFLKSNFPHYLYTDSVINDLIQAVPHDKIKNIYYPHDYIDKLFQKKKSPLEKIILKFIKYIIKYCKILMIDLGITGSHMVGLNTPQSDIDLIVYGEKNCYKLYNNIHRLFDDESISVQRYDLEDLKRLYDFRGKDTKIDFENFVQFEKKKKLQGKFKHIDFYIRCIKAWDEIKEEYGYFTYKPIGNALIQGFIINDKGSIFTPCCYKIDDVKFLQGTKVDNLREIFSYRGRCCEAKKEEPILARGKIELVKGKNGEQYHRLIVGGEKGDFLCS
ncbi:MAG: nucleotidyltransferase domain-containing protein [Candidatus Helarchaeota archaeon]|nr:nucleotidyltransferase domain-containing protein [Candidatus Helarchaeota archaeon]